MPCVLTLKAGTWFQQAIESVGFWVIRILSNASGNTTLMFILLIVACISWPVAE